MRTRIRRAMTGFWRDRAGVSYVLVAAALVPLVGMVGLATDTSRGYLVRGQLRDALDAATLAAAQHPVEADQRTDLNLFFDANLPAGFMDATVPDPVLAYDPQTEVLTATATATIPTTFMRILGIDTITVSARSVVQREVRGMELVLVMDNTGSMHGSKMTTMKTAAQDLIDILYGARTTVPELWIGLVPYTSAVNVGAAHSLWIDGLNPAAYQPDPQGWKGCVEARHLYGRDMTDDPYTVERWQPYLYPNDIDNYWQDGDDILGAYLRWTTGSGDSVPLADLIEAFVRQELALGAGDPLPESDLIANVQRVMLEQDGLDRDDPLPEGQTLTDALEDYLDPNTVDPFPTDIALRDYLLMVDLLRDYYEVDLVPVAAVRSHYNDRNEGTGPNLGCGPAITPLTDAKTAIDAAIAEMQAWHRGGTASNLGLVWGWRVLSPRWQLLWGDDVPADRPVAYDHDLTDKVVIVLTDGENQVYDHDREGPLGSDYTGYGRLGEARTGTTSKSAAKDILDDRMEAVCTAMKAEGIIIYAITFQVSNQATRDMFERCASTPDRYSSQYYFNSPTNEDLEQVFRTIAGQLSNLRLVE